MKSSLLLLLIATVLLAEQYSVSQETISKNRFFAITDLIEEIPVLETHILDVADVSLSTGGYNSLTDRTLLLCVDGLPIHNFYDGRQLFSQRLVQNSDIDSIIVLTGIDAYRYGSEASTVINLITKSADKYQKFHFKPYVGSEVGDPTLLKKILPADSVPPNKDQVLAGESYFTFKRNKQFFKGGISIELMDPYTSMGEGLRSKYYPEQNSHQSLLERKEGHFRWGVKGEKISSMTALVAGDYSNFRYSPFNSRYYYYEGLNGIVRNRTTLQQEKLSLGVSLDLLYDQGHFYESAEDSTETDHYAITGEINSAYKLSENRSISGHVTLKKSKEQPQFGSLLQMPDTSMVQSAHLGLELRRAHLRITYPLGVHFQFAHRDNLKGSYGITYPTDASGAIYDGELRWTKQSASNSLSVTGAIKVTPTYELIQRGHNLYREYDKEYRFIPQISVINKHFIFGQAIGNLSTYGGKLRIIRDIPLRDTPLKDIYFRGQLNFTLPTYWRGFTPLSYADKSEGEKIDGFITGSLALIYTMPKERVHFSAAIRNIGKKHYEIPGGSMVGPIVVTSMEITF